MSQTKIAIVGHGTASPGELMAHPCNHRKHPLDQKAAMLAILNTVGWVDTILVNRRSNRIINGHLRVEIAADRNESSIPVRYIDVDEGEEAAILATFDSSAALADVDKDLLRQLAEQAGITDGPLAQMLIPVVIDPTVPADDQTPLAEPAEIEAVPELAGEPTVKIRCGPLEFEVGKSMFDAWNSRNKAIAGKGMKNMAAHLQKLLGITDDELSESDSPDL